MRRLPYSICDVFTDVPLAGNQLAVFTTPGLDPALMQALAREVNFSETVFVLPPEAGGHFRLRIFTPKIEVPFAGHPTLGAAFVLGRSVQLDELVLETGRGLVSVRLEREAARPVFGWMQQPLPACEPFPEPALLLEALGATASELPVDRYDNGLRHALVALPSSEQLAALAPDTTRLARLPTETVVAFCGGDGRFEARVFAPAGGWGGGDGRFEARVFAPAAGIAEDPATGSAAGPLALHLTRHGRAEPGDVLRIEQGRHIGRPSTLYARITGPAANPERVEVGGAAVVVARGEFQL